MKTTITSDSTTRNIYGQPCTVIAVTGARFACGHIDEVHLAVLGAGPEAESAAKARAAQWLSWQCSRCAMADFDARNPEA